MRNRLLLSMLALIGLALTSLPADAQIRATYQFALNDANGTPISGTPSIQQGTTFTWKVFLLDNNTFTGTGAGAPPAPFLNAPKASTIGLAGAGVTVASSSAASLTVNSNPPPPTGNTGNSSTTPNGSAAVGTSWQTWSNNNSVANSIHLNVGTFGTPVSADATGRVLIGTYTFTAGTPGSVTLTASDPNPLATGDTAYAGDGSSLDASIGNGTSTLTITAVPEPGSMLLCGLGAVGLAAYRRRTRKTAVVETVA